MPLRDHFHAPLDAQTSWDVVHGMWPAMMVMELNAHLPSQFVAGPHVHLGSEIEVDVASFEQPSVDSPRSTNFGAWTLTEPNMVVETELLTIDEYEVQIHDTRQQRRLVAVIEIVSPSNKNRPESRQMFTAKCATLLREGVSVAIVDIVTSRHFNLYIDLLDWIGQQDASLGPTPPTIYATASRWLPRGRKHVLESWSHRLHIDQTLPTLPIWLADNLAVPLDLEACYEAACRALRIA